MPDSEEIYQGDLIPLFDDFWSDVSKLVAGDTTGLDAHVKSRVESLAEAMKKVANDRGIEWTPDLFATRHKFMTEAGTGKRLLRANLDTMWRNSRRKSTPDLTFVPNARNSKSLSLNNVLKELKKKLFDSDALPNAGPSRSNGSTDTAQPESSSGFVWDPNDPTTWPELDPEWAMNWTDASFPAPEQTFSTEEWEQIMRNL